MPSTGPMPPKRKCARMPKSSSVSRKSFATPRRRWCRRRMTSTRPKKTLPMPMLNLRKKRRKSKRYPLFGNMTCRLMCRLEVWMLSSSSLTLLSQRKWYQGEGIYNMNFYFRRIGLRYAINERQQFPFGGLFLGMLSILVLFCWILFLQNVIIVSKRCLAEILHKNL